MDDFSLGGSRLELSRICVVHKDFGSGWNSEMREEYLIPCVPEEHKGKMVTMAGIFWIHIAVRYFDYS
jgi:hypothetical protein